MSVMGSKQTTFRERKPSGKGHGSKSMDEEDENNGKGDDASGKKKAFFEGFSPLDVAAWASTATGELSSANCQLGADGVVSAAIGSGWCAFLASFFSTKQGFDTMKEEFDTMKEDMNEKINLLLLMNIRRDMKEEIKVLEQQNSVANRERIILLNQEIATINLKLRPVAAALGYDEV